MTEKKEVKAPVAKEEVAPPTITPEVKPRKLYSFFEVAKFYGLDDNTELHSILCKNKVEFKILDDYVTFSEYDDMDLFRVEQTVMEDAVVANRKITENGKTFIGKLLKNIFA